MRYLRAAGMKRIAILGSTGSIGTSALAVVDAHPDRLRGRRRWPPATNAAALAAQIARYRPRVVAHGRRRRRCAGARRASRSAAHGCTAGADGLVAVATHPDVDIVLCASSGTAALEAVLAAIDAGKTIALANKEVLVMAGGS